MESKNFLNLGYLIQMANVDISRFKLFNKILINDTIYLFQIMLNSF